MIPPLSTRQIRPWSLLALVWLLGLPATASADVVWLKNGDRLTGHIVRMQDDELLVNTDQAGDVYISWGNVESLISDKPLSIQFRADAAIPANFGKRDGDRIIVHELEEGGLVDLSTIRSINQVELYMKGDVSLGGSFTTGNTDTEALNASLHWLFRKNRHKVTLQGIVNRSKADGELTVENARGGIRYDYFLTRQLFTWFQQNLEQDTFQSLALRSNTTGGLGYEFLNYKRHQLKLGGGPAAVYTVFTNEPGFVDPSASWFLVWYYELYRDIVKLYHRHQGWRDLGRTPAFRWNAIQGLRVKLYKNLNANVQYDIRLNTEPVQDRKELDTSFIFGLTYEYEQ